VGDFQKLWTRLVASEGSGVAGAVITVCLYVGIGVMALLTLYEYMVYVHKVGGWSHHGHAAFLSKPLFKAPLQTPYTYLST
jgi:hypothetical protein